jgi:hypothetical protein
LLLHLQKSIVTFLGQLVTELLRLQLVLLLQETTKLSSSKDDIKIDAFLITDYFSEGINYFYVLLFASPSGG